MLSFECSCQRMIVGFCDRAISDPLPELRLRRPKLLSITANNQGCSLLYLLFPGLACAHPSQRSLTCHEWQLAAHNFMRA